jgi:succinyl-diaminopimelate desuccinylase
MPFDPISLAQELIRAPSVTPEEAGALDLIERMLKQIGFRTQRLKFGDVDNLYARLGAAQPNFCFAGHVDVVPPGQGWSGDPFSGDIRDGKLYGRGASDMKAAIAAMIAATDAYVQQAGAPNGSISFLLTCDEEGPGVDGTVKVLEALATQGEKLDHCLVGEPTSADRFGDVIKNGRRGSLNALITMRGKQGHVAYPQLAANPVTALIDACAALKARKLDDGAPGFDPSNLEVTSLDVGNPTHNVIPSQGQARLNIRFNTEHNGETLKSWIETTVKQAAARYAGIEADTRVSVSGEPFYTDPGPFTALLQEAVKQELGDAAILATTGGTSDARFIKNYCVVAEFGMLNDMAHKVDEHVALEDITALTRIYVTILKRYFA